MAHNHYPNKQEVRRTNETFRTTFNICICDAYQFMTGFGWSTWRENKVETFGLKRVLNREINVSLLKNLAKKKVIKDFND